MKYFLFEVHEITFTNDRLKDTGTVLLRYMKYQEFFLINNLTI